MTNPIDVLDDFIIRFKTGCYGLIPAIVLSSLVGICVIPIGLFVDTIPKEKKPSWLIFGAGTGVALALCLFDVVAISLEYKKRKRKNPHRGHFLKKESMARRDAAKLLAKHHHGDRGVAWGKLRIPSKALEKSFLVLGNIGSGKTLTFSMLMQDQLPLIVPGSDRRALIYDSQQQFVQIVAGMPVDCPRILLNPFDERHVAWDIATDVDSLTVDNFALHLVPHNPKNSTQYFDNATRAIISAVLQVFIDQAPGKWTFRHLRLVMRSLDRIKQITNKCVDTREIITALLTDASDKARGDIISTIVTESRKYEKIAACWDGNPIKLSIKEWLSGPSETSSAILVMGNYEPARSVIDLVNGLYLDMIAKYGLSLPDSKKRKTWLFLDEFAEAGKFESFRSLVLRGRSKGFVSVVGLQDPKALYSIYGKDDAEAFIKQSGNRAFLHLKSPDAAHWASECVSEGIQSFDDVDERKYFRATLPPQAFLRLPESDPDINGLEGYYANGSLGWWHASYSPQELKELLPEANKRVRPFVKISHERTVLKHWSKEDADLFGVPFDKDDRDPLDDVGPLRL